MEVAILDREGRNVLVDDTEGDDSVSPNGGGSVLLPKSRVREGETRRDTWERIRKEARASGMSRRAAYDYATREADRLFAAGMTEAPEPFSMVDADPPAAVEPPAAPETPLPDSGGGVAGLGDLPSDWPVLPANASLQAEVAWVQANRLRVVQGDHVDLSRSLSPAPSYAALSWLETAMLFPAKWADVTVKASQDQQDDQQDVRRERAALGEVRTLLAESSAADA